MNQADVFIHYNENLAITTASLFVQLRIGMRHYIDFGNFYQDDNGEEIPDTLEYEYDK